MRDSPVTVNLRGILKSYVVSFSRKYHLPREKLPIRLTRRPQKGCQLPRWTKWRYTAKTTMPASLGGGNRYLVNERAKAWARARRRAPSGCPPPPSLCSRTGRRGRGSRKNPSRSTVKSQTQPPSNPPLKTVVQIFPLDSTPRYFGIQFHLINFISSICIILFNSTVSKHIPTCSSTAGHQTGYDNPTKRVIIILPKNQDPCFRPRFSFYSSPWKRSPSKKIARARFFKLIARNEISKKLWDFQKIKKFLA